MAGKRKSTPVPAAPIRAWAATQPQFAGRAFAATETEYAGTNPRGRMPKDVVEAYEAAHPGEVYTPGHKPTPMVPLTVTTTDKKGRKRTRKVQKSRADVLTLAGKATNTKGVLSSTTIEAAEVALSAELQA